MNWVSNKNKITASRITLMALSISKIAMRKIMLLFIKEKIIKDTQNMHHYSVKENNKTIKKKNMLRLVNLITRIKKS